MASRLTLTTALVAVFGMAFSFFAQNTASRPGSAFASVTGKSCSYAAGEVCPIKRDESVQEPRF